MKERELRVCPCTSCSLPASEHPTTQQTQTSAAALLARVTRWPRYWELTRAQSALMKTGLVLHAPPATSAASPTGITARSATKIEEIPINYPPMLVYGVE